MRKLSEGEGHLDLDQHRNGLPETGAGPEHPLLHSALGLLIETERRVERTGHAYLSDRTVLHHDRLEPHHALNLGSHGVGGVVRFDLADEHRRRHAIARTVRASAKAPAVARAEARPVARANA